MFQNIFGEKFYRNPNDIDLTLFSTEIKVLKQLVQDYMNSGKSTCDENYFLFAPILQKLEKALSEENKKKSREKAYIKKEETEVA